MRNGLRGKPELGRYDYDGKKLPQKHGDGWVNVWGGKTFSVGIYRWVSVTENQCKRDLPSHLKRGKVICRVKGLTSEPEKVYEMAEEICDELERGGQVAVNYYALGKIYTAERRAK